MNETKYLVYNSDTQKIYMTEKEIFEDFKYTLSLQPQRLDEIALLIKDFYRIESDEIAERIEKQILNDDDIIESIGVDNQRWINHKDYEEEEI